MNFWGDTIQPVTIPKQSRTKIHGIILLKLAPGIGGPRSHRLRPARPPRKSILLHAMICLEKMPSTYFEEDDLKF